MKWPFARVSLPGSLKSELEPGEQVQSMAELADGGQLAVTRFGLWHVPADGPAVRTGWQVISKVRWAAGILTVTVADVEGELGGAQLLRDRDPVLYQVSEPRKTTDHIHARTRSGIAQAVHYPLPGGSGWVIMRKVPGRDGLVPQVRLDPGTPPDPAVEAAIIQILAARQTEPDDID